MKKNHIAALLLCMIMISGVFGAHAFADDPEYYHIGNAEDLKKIADIPGAHYELDCDIDMSGNDWEPIAFSGTLIGNGHTIYNLKVTSFGKDRADTLDGNAKVYDSVFAGLFSVLKGAKIQDLNLRGVDIDVSSEIHCFAGGFAGYMKDTVISGCSITDARISITPRCQPEADNPRKSCNSGVGGIAGFGSGTIENCTVDAILIFRDECSSKLKVEEFMGGAVSDGNPTLKNCSISIDGYCECRGYCHNGGLVGMYYQYDKSEEVGTITDCSVSGMITFFEDNRDRRAYCEAYIGERMNWPKMSGCSQKFTRNETKNYKAHLSPEKCGEPYYTEEITAPVCGTGSCGYTQYTCKVCGYSFKTAFTVPAHTPGEWVTVKEARNGASGLRQKSCTVCGKVTEEETLIPVMDVEIERKALDLNYKDETMLSASVVPKDAADQTIVWTSSDEKVASVGQDGIVRATGRGTATITASSSDGYAKNHCEVKVGYTFGQWLIKIIMFGWIWY